MSSRAAAPVTSSPSSLTSILLITAPEPEVSEAAAARAFSTSIVISATRCLLAYIVFPWLLPILGVTSGVGPGLGLVIGVVAVGFNVASIRRFHRSGHRWRWVITALNAGVIVLLAVLIVRDLADLAG